MVKRMLLCLLAVLLVAGVAWAGDLSPPDPGAESALSFSLVEVSRGDAVGVAAPVRLARLVTMETFTLEIDRHLATIRSIETRANIDAHLIGKATFDTGFDPGGYWLRE
jgi:hypothetical protein